MRPLLRTVGEYLRGAGVVGMERRGVGRGRLIKSAQVVGVAPHVVEGAHRGIGIVEAGNAGPVQNLLAGGTDSPPIQLASTGLPESLGIRLQLLGNQRGIGHALRRHDDQHAVDVRVLGGDLQRLGVALRFGIAQNVHRIGVAPRRRAGWR